MSGIAEVLLRRGYAVSGSDLKANPLTAELERKGAQFFLGHRAENIPETASVVVASSAIATENPELLEATRRGIPVIPRAEMLAELMRTKYGIAVAGSHGKTTTTSMCAKLVRDSGLDPTVIIGGRVLNQATGANHGTGEYLIAEADESDGSFCLLRPAIAVVTNIDAEHMPHYGSFEALEEAFLSFANSVPFYGLVIACEDDMPTRKMLSSVKRRVLRYGLDPECDVYASDIEQNGPVTNYTLHISGKEVAQIALPMPGRHMLLNSLAAASVATELGIYPDEIATSLADFAGVSRRTERIAEHQDVLVLDDYAHHPTEIAATLRAVRSGWLPHQAKKAKRGSLGKVHVIFEPHRYSRTQDLFEHFRSAFIDADSLTIGEIYAAGEEPIEGVSGESLAKSIDSPSARFLPELQSSLPEIAANVEPGDIVITLGAGAVGRLATEFAQLLEQK